MSWIIVDFKLVRSQNSFIDCFHCLLLLRLSSHITLELTLLVNSVCSLSPNNHGWGKGAIREPSKYTKMSSNSKSLDDSVDYLDCPNLSCLFTFFSREYSPISVFHFEISIVYSKGKYPLYVTIPSIFMTHYIFNCFTHLLNQQVFPEYLLCARPCGRGYDLMVN